MSVWLLLQIAFNIFLFLAVWMLWTKFRRPPKDDPRLSRGLQLLQSKISVLEDLSDKTDNQVKQLSNLLERKCREVQNKIEEATQQMNRIDQSIAKSLDVASIFEDRIPHQEIIERQRTRAYVKAAKLAHQGMGLEEIAEKVDLSRGELEMIVKVNRDRLMFSEEDLPPWARSEAGNEDAAERVDFQMKEQTFDEEPEVHSDLGRILKPVIEPPKTLEKIGAEFRKACQEVREQEEQMEVESKTETLVQQLSSSAVNKLKKISKNAKERIQEMNLLEDDEESVSTSSFVEEEELRAASQAVKHEIRQMAQRPAAKVSFKMPEKNEKKPAKTQPIFPKQQQAVLRPTGTKMVDSDQIKKVKFPRIDMSDLGRP